MEGGGKKKGCAPSYLEGSQETITKYKKKPLLGGSKKRQKNIEGSEHTDVIGKTCGQVMRGCHKQGAEQGNYDKPQKKKKTQKNTHKGCGEGVNGPLAQERVQKIVKIPKKVKSRQRFKTPQKKKAKRWNRGVPHTHGL